MHKSCRFYYLLRYYDLLVVIKMVGLFLDCSYKKFSIIFYYFTYLIIKNNFYELCANELYFQVEVLYVYEKRGNALKYIIKKYILF